MLIGYSIFVLIGSLPTCEADELLSLIPYQTHGGGKTQQQRDCSSSASENEDEQMLAEAIALSLSGRRWDTWEVSVYSCYGDRDSWE